MQETNMRLTNWAIRERQIGTHHLNLTRELTANNTSIFRKQKDINGSLINKATLTKLETHKIDRQDTGISRTLKSFSNNVIPQNIYN